MSCAKNVVYNVVFNAFTFIISMYVVGEIMWCDNTGNGFLFLHFVF